MYIDNEIVPYAESLALKELGFDYSCLGYYNDQGNYINETKNNSNCNKLGMHGSYCTAPLFSQAFRWFRETHKLDSYIRGRESMGYEYSISGVDIFNAGEKVGLKTIFSDIVYGSYDQTQLECLRELINRCIIK